MSKTGAKEAGIVWQGDSHKVLKGWPKDVKIDIGGELRRLQNGKKTLMSKPFPGIGKGVFEIKAQDGSHWYRVVYVSKVGNTIYVLHSFTKKSGSTSNKDVNTIKARYSAAQPNAGKKSNNGKKTKKLKK